MRFERASAPGRHDGDVAAGAELSEKSIRSACTACGLFLLAAASIAVPGQAAYADVTFKEVSSISGIRFTGRSFGISAGDLNGDGWPDIFSGNHRSLASLYINNGDGTFTDVIPNNWSNPVLPDGHGAAFADFDNDGDQDLLQLVGAGAGSGEGPNVFLQNSDGVLEDRAAQFAIDYPIGRGRTPAWFDWNNDSVLDLFLSNTKRSDGNGDSVLFIGDGSQFQIQPDVTDIVGGLYGQISDLDGDGSLELLTHSRFGYPSKIFAFGQTPTRDLRPSLNITQRTKVADTAIEDFDGDLRPDIYMARLDSSASEVVSTGSQVRARILADRTERQFSFRANGSISVSVQPAWTLSANKIFIGTAGRNPSGNNFSLDANNAANHGIANHAAGGDKGVYIGYNPNAGRWEVAGSAGGRLDINIQVRSTGGVSGLQKENFGSAILAEKDQLLMNRGSRFEFANSTMIPGGNNSCESVGAGDFDNDMDVDIYLVCRGQTRNQPNWLLLNDGNGRFERVAGAGGAEGTSSGRGDSVAVVDYNNDGFLDLAVTNGNGEDPFAYGHYELFRNDGNQNNWLQFDLAGVQSNRDGIGAKVTITTPDSKQQMRERDGGYHRSSQNFMRLHFGLAQNQTADVTVEWPSGQVTQYNNVAANAIYTLSESGSITDRALAPVDAYECSQPEMDNDSDQAVFIYKNCFNGRWTIRATGGPDEAQFDGFVRVNSSDVSNLQLLSIESADRLQATGNAIEFEFDTTAGGFDGFAFDLDEGADACLDFRSSRRVEILLGGNRTAHRVPFNLGNLGRCTGLSNDAAPVIRSIADQANDTGDEVSLKLEATDGDGDWAYFSATGLPPGLTVNEGTAEIIGTPTTAGTFTIELRAEDGRGKNDTATFGWTISDTSPPPPPPPPPPTPSPGNTGGGGGGTPLGLLLLMTPVLLRRLNR